MIIDSKRYNYSQSLDVDKVLIEKIEQHFECEYIETDKDESQYARADGFLIKDKKVIGLAENRCRATSNLKQLQSYDNYFKGGDCMVTKSKIDTDVEVAKALCIPFYFFLYIPKGVSNDNNLENWESMYWQVIGDNGERDKGKVSIIKSNHIPTQKSLADNAKVIKENYHFSLSQATKF